MAFLAFLSSDACIEACRAYLAPEHLAYALCRLWFDEIYVPSDSYLDSLKGYQSEEEVKRFWACFSDTEKAMMERFHGFLELRINFATNRAKGRAYIPDNDSWRSIRRDAAHLLEDLAPDPEHIRQGLAGLVEALIGQQDGGPELEKSAVRALLGHD